MDKAIWLRGNISDGFTPFGPYPDIEAAFMAHEGEEGWALTLNPPRSARGGGTLVDPEHRALKALVEGHDEDPPMLTSEEWNEARLVLAQAEGRDPLCPCGCEGREDDHDAAVAWARAAEAGITPETWIAWGMPDDSPEEKGVERLNVLFQASEMTEVEQGVVLGSLMAHREWSPLGGMNRVWWRVVQNGGPK